MPEELQEEAEPPPAAKAPPGPETVSDPELEERPERTVRVVFIGDANSVGSLRKSLKRLSSEAFDVQWSR